MRLGYNTNGLAHHEPLAAIRLLAEIGYESVALTLDHGLLNPRDQRLEVQLGALRSALTGYGLRSVIETGARFLLDPLVKHEPTLMSASPRRRAVRVDFLKHAIDMARELRSDCVSFWSGVLRDEVSGSSHLARRDETPPLAEREGYLDRLVAALEPVVDYADRQGVILAFEPEPGMFIDTMARFEQLQRRIAAPHFRLTLDVGHLHCLGETPIANVIRRWGPQLANIHLEDMRAGVHEHLMFGEGEMDFPPILAALREAGYTGGLHVELSRHSHDGANAARRAYEFLEPHHHVGN